MISSSIPAETRIAALGLDPFLPAEQVQASLPDDEQLITELAATNLEAVRYPARETALTFASLELAGHIRKSYDVTSLHNIEGLLKARGTMNIPIVRGHTVTVDGVERDIAIVAATEISADGANHGDMSSMLYLRDQIQAASALMELSLRDPNRYNEESDTGRTLLMSALHCMSTESQLKRFQTVIQRGPTAGQADWPQISLHFDDLNGERPNGWRNKQDSFQMLAYTTLDAIERGFLDIEDLGPAHKQFLGSIVPFLKAVGFPCYENSGSWEEVAATRTSVMAVETALLYKIQRLYNTPGLGFLAKGFAESMPARREEEEFQQTVDKMVHVGLTELGKRLPDESPDYPHDSVKHRKADVALAYVLRYDLPRLLADQNIPMAANDNEPMTAEAIEHLVLKKLHSLIDPGTNGLIRYNEDSYQRDNFHTNAVQLIVAAVKRKVQHDAQVANTEIDLDKKQWLRGELTPSGTPAAWTHPLGQISSWAAKRSLESVTGGDGALAERYRELSTLFLNASLSMITGEDQWHAVLDSTGHYQPRKVPAYKLPECYVAYRLPNGDTFRVPSPHTPLNWSSAMLKEAVGLLTAATAAAPAQ